MSALTNTDILKGSAINLFFDGSTLGFATNHQLSVTVNTEEIATKDHGDYPAVLATTVNWSITADHMYTTTEGCKMMNMLRLKTPVDIIFATVANYSNTDEQGIIDVKDHDNWQYTGGKSTILAKGKVLITNLTINSQSGERATVSIEMTGVGTLVASTSPGSTGTNLDDVGPTA